MTVKEIEVKSVMTKSNLPVADFSVNPYVGCAHACKYCYASFMKRFTNHLEPWGTFIDVKRWPPIRRTGRYAGKEAFLGSVTDCYQPCEAKFRRTRALLEELQGSGIRLSIATKSDLVLRDLDLITYWSKLDARLQTFAAAEGLPYLRAEDNRMADFDEPPIVVNYFYHEQVRKSARQNA